MRFQISLFTLIYVVLFASFSHALVGPTCMKIPDALGEKPDKIYKLFYKEICEKGCTPDITHFDKWARRHVLRPLVTQTMKKLGVPQYTKTVENLVQAAAKTSKENCAKELDNSHLCENPKKFEAFGQCLKGSLLPVVMSRVGELGPLLAEPVCQKAYDYLQKPDLWEKVIPRYIALYSKVCDKL
jgi:hypothetical protein